MPCSNLRVCTPQLQQPRVFPNPPSLHMQHTQPTVQGNGQCVVHAHSACSLLCNMQRLFPPSCFTVSKHTIATSSYL